MIIPLTKENSIVSQGLTTEAWLPRKQGVQLTWVHEQPGCWDAFLIDNKELAIRKPIEKAKI